VTELRVDTFKMLGSRSDNEAAPRNPSNGAPRQQRTNQKPQQPSGGFDDDDDSIPF
jgi:single-stranded DNA-binding protein